LSVAPNDNPSHSYGASLATWDHTVLPGTRHQWTIPALRPARQVSTRLHVFTYPRGMESWVDLSGCFISRWFTTCLWTVTHVSSNHLIATRPGVELTTS